MAKKTVPRVPNNHDPGLSGLSNAMSGKGTLREHESDQASIDLNLNPEGNFDSLGLLEAMGGQYQLRMLKSNELKFGSDGPFHPILIHQASQKQQEDNVHYRA